ncbi:hypothetical protein J6590_014611, partial [Homalodisca vitripennis]
CEVGSARLGSPGLRHGWRSALGPGRSLNSWREAGRKPSLFSRLWQFLQLLLPYSPAPLAPHPPRPVPAVTLIVIVMLSGDTERFALQPVYCCELLENRVQCRLRKPTCLI